MRGTPAAYAALAQKDVDTLYFIAESDADEGYLYWGNKLIAGGNSNGSADGLLELLNLNDLADVLVNDLALADVSFLVYDPSENTWINREAKDLIFTGCTSLSNGGVGLVPAPAKGEENYFLRADGTWAPVACSSAVYQAILEADETKEEAIARVVGSNILNNGDIAIVKVQLAEDKYEHTAYVYNGNDWIAMDGNYSAENVYFTEDFIFTESVGTVVVDPEVGNATVSAAGVNVKDFLASLFSTPKDPKVTDPSMTVKYTDTSTSYEVGTKVTPKYSISFDPGEYEYGPATGVTVSSYVVSDSTGGTSSTANGSMSEITVADDTSYTISATVNYLAGSAVPVNNLGQTVPSLQIDDGSLTKSTAAIKGYRAAFAGIDTTTGAIDSDLIRGLSTKWNYNAKKVLTFDASTVTGATRFIVAVPVSNTRGGLVDAIITSSMNANCTDDYDLMDAYVSVEGANDYAGVDYKVWVYAPASIGAKEIHEVTMN